MANDSTVKAGSWGARTVEKIIRIIERASAERIPMVYLVDSAGARITDQVQLFPGRRGAGAIFAAQIAAGGVIPQVCALFGPSAAGGAYIPAFCDVVVMVDGNASMYLGSPRMVEMVTGEKTTLEEMGGARMHTTVSGVGHLLAGSETEALDQVRRYLSYLPDASGRPLPVGPAGRTGSRATCGRWCPPTSGRRSTCAGTSGRWSTTAASWRSSRAGPGRSPSGSPGWTAVRWAWSPTIRCSRPGCCSSTPRTRRPRSCKTCGAFGIPLVFLADVPGFMVGAAVERQGIIRHGAAMIAAVTRAAVPKICVVVRKAYGAGLYAMAGPGFAPTATLALPTAKIAVMGADAAVNAVWANQIAALPDDGARIAFVAERRAAYEADIDVLHLAAELVVDDIVEPEDLRAQLVARLRFAGGGAGHPR